MCVLGLVGFVAACGGSDRPAGTIEGKRRPDVVDSAAQNPQERAPETLVASADGRAPAHAKSILFGDLHVHTTYSLDAFASALPLMAGEGAHPPADACDFARYCASLDFYALTDHAETLTPAHWAAEKESVRQCNALAGDPANPDLVAFMGFEWTQMGATPETHFGHRNVIFRGLADTELPARPIGAGGGDLDRIGAVRSARWVDPFGWKDYTDLGWLAQQIKQMPQCASGVNARDLPPDCRENAATPDVLFEKLNQWGVDSMVIPHGTAWGLYTPPGASIDAQLTRRYYDPDRQRLIEVMSGHGNSEEYRSWREVEYDARGNPVCPKPTPDYLPCCWQAGEIMRRRCGDVPPVECEARVAAAKRLALEWGTAPTRVFADSDPEDWLDCGQCRNCFKPDFSYRPRESVQYAMALSNFEEPDERGNALRFRYGFVASSDSHTARPGTGYKQYERRKMTEAKGLRSRFFRGYLQRLLAAQQDDPRQPQAPPADRSTVIMREPERIASFFYPGGLVAVHARGRSREVIWDALKQREVYGTSGPHILLWFDLLNGDNGRAPMGSAVTLSRAPRFEVRAVGAFVQQAGCPQTSVRGLPAERLHRLCRGECFHPSDVRHRILSIEVVRIRPQGHPGEDVTPLIQDPWRRFDCPPDPMGCSVRFDDPEFPGSGRDALYYVRALQEATAAVNGANLRTQFDSKGDAMSVKPCYGDYRTPFDDDCLAPVHERAWSSPIFVDQPRGNRTP
jgi:hypothetical protein